MIKPAEFYTVSNVESIIYPATVAKINNCCLVVGLRALVVAAVSDLDLKMTELSPKNCFSKKVGPPMAEILRVMELFTVIRSRVIIRYVNLSSSGYLEGKYPAASVQVINAKIINQLKSSFIGISNIFVSSIFFIILYFS